MITSHSGRTAKLEIVDVIAARTAKLEMVDGPTIRITFARHDDDDRLPRSTAVILSSQEMSAASQVIDECLWRRMECRDWEYNRNITCRADVAGAAPGNIWIGCGTDRQHPLHMIITLGSNGRLGVLLDIENGNMMARHAAAAARAMRAPDPVAEFNAAMVLEAL